MIRKKAVVTQLKSTNNQMKQACSDPETHTWVEMYSFQALRRRQDSQKQLAIYTKFILQFVSIYICYLDICMSMKSELGPNSDSKLARSSGPSHPAVPAYYNYLIPPMTNQLITSHLHFGGLIPVNGEASFPIKWRQP
jgi:hypothetical protein